MTRAFGHGPLNFGMMTPAIKGLVVANIAVFVLQSLFQERFIALFGLTPAKVIGELYLWQPLTYLFLHAGMFHLLFNLFALWMFGMPVEQEWGAKEFLRFVLLCGVGAGLINVAFTPDSPYPIIGASGAVYGLLVAFAMLYPDAVVYLYFFFPIKAKHMAMLFGALEFLASTSSGGGAVARFAHLGGMLIAFLYIRWGRALSLYGEGLARELVRRAGGGPPRSRRPRRTEAAPGTDEAAEVDRILDKILAHGEESLTETERQTLRRQAKRKPEGHA